MRPYMTRSLYHSKFEALLRYGIIFWRADNENLPILKLQKKVMQIRCGVDTGTYCTQLFTDYKILTVTSLYVLEVICFMKKYKSWVEQNVHVHDYNMRKKMDLHVLQCNTNLFKRSVINMGI
jgi:hypothetical protein